jgi:hypothetical protein
MCVGLLFFDLLGAKHYFDFFFQWHFRLKHFQVLPLGPLWSWFPFKRACEVCTITSFFSLEFRRPHVLSFHFNPAESFTS